MTTPTSLKHAELLSLLSTRLDAVALDNLAKLSVGQEDFVLYMLRKLQQLLADVCPRLESRWAERDFRGLALEVHKLRSSVSYAGAKKLDSLVGQCEPLLRVHDGDSSKPDNARGEAAAREAIAEARGLLEWLNTTLPAA